jgi:hypothetical protein
MTEVKVGQVWSDSRVDRLVVHLDSYEDGTPVAVMKTIGHGGSLVPFSVKTIKEMTLKSDAPPEPDEVVVGGRYVNRYGPLATLATVKKIFKEVEYVIDRTGELSFMGLEDFSANWMPVNSVNGIAAAIPLTVEGTYSDGGPGSIRKVKMLVQQLQDRVAALEQRQGQDDNYAQEQNERK